MSSIAVRPPRLSPTRQPNSAHSRPGPLPGGHRRGHAGILATAWFTRLSGGTALLVLLRAVWAGALTRGSAAGAPGWWLDLHLWLGRLTLGGALLATLVCAALLRARHDLLLGGAALVGLLAAEARVGDLVGQAGSLGAIRLVHLPLALAAMLVATWLPLRSGTLPGVRPAQTRDVEDRAQ